LNRRWYGSVTAVRLAIWLKRSSHIHLSAQARSTTADLQGIVTNETESVLPIPTHSHVLHRARAHSRLVDAVGDFIRTLCRICSVRGLRSAKVDDPINSVWRGAPGIGDFLHFLSLARFKFARVSMVHSANPSAA